MKINFSRNAKTMFLCFRNLPLHENVNERHLRIFKGVNVIFGLEKTESLKTKTKKTKKIQSSPTISELTSGNLKDFSLRRKQNKEQEI